MAIALASLLFIRHLQENSSLTPHLNGSLLNAVISKFLVEKYLFLVILKGFRIFLGVAWKC